MGLKLGVYMVFWFWLFLLGLELLLFLGLCPLLLLQLRGTLWGGFCCCIAIDLKGAEQ